MREPAICSPGSGSGVVHGWSGFETGMERYGMERGLERNGPLQHSTATMQHIFIKIGSLERE